MQLELLAIVLALVPILHDTQATSSRPVSGSIKVVVRDASSGAPLDGLEVAVEKDGGGITAITDVSGSAEFLDVAAGPYIVKISNRNQLETPDQITKFTVFGSRRTVVKAGVTSTLEFAVRRPATLRGQVLTPEGRPVVSAPVEVLTALRTVRGRPVLTSGLPRGVEPTTDAEGRFAVAGVAPGSYFVRVSLPPIDNVPLNSVYAPGVISSASAARINLESGDDVSVNVRAIGAPTVDVEGRVVNRSGEGVGGLQIRLRSLDQPTVGAADDATASDRDGHFVLKDVRSGAYALQAVGRASASESVVLAGATDVDVAEKPPGSVEITVVPGAVIVGHVFFNGAEQPGRVRAEVTVKAEGDDADTRQGLSPTPEWHADGSFAISGVLGRHRLALLSNSSWFIERAFLDDGTDIADAAFDFEAGRVYRKVRVLLSDQTAQIIAKLPKDMDMSPIAIIAFPEDSSLWRDERYVRMVSAGEPQAELAIKGIPPGRNYLVAIRTLSDRGDESTALRNPADLLDGLVHSVRVFVGEPGSFTVNLPDPNPKR